MLEQKWGKSKVACSRDLVFEDPVINDLALYDPEKQDVPSHITE